MSSYTAKFRRKDTGDIVTVDCLDDYFGKYLYGYRVLSGTIYREDEFFNIYEPIEPQPTAEVEPSCELIKDIDAILNDTNQLYFWKSSVNLIKKLESEASFNRTLTRELKEANHLADETERMAKLLAKCKTVLQQKPKADVELAKAQKRAWKELKKYLFIQDCKIETRPLSQKSMRVILNRCIKVALLQTKGE